MGLCGITGSHWLVGRRVSGEGGRGVKKTGCLLECQSEEQEVWHVRVDFNKVTDKRRSSVSSVKRGRYVGTRRFRVRGQRTPEVNKVALIALKYFNALIAAKLIASINALTLTALIKMDNIKHVCYSEREKHANTNLLTLEEQDPVKAHSKYCTGTAILYWGLYICQYLGKLAALTYVKLGTTTSFQQFCINKYRWISVTLKKT